MSKVITQKVTFKATPAEVYSAFMDSKKHSAFTGVNAKIGKKVGDSFTAHDDYISGVNVALIPNKKIVQLWHCTDWEENEYSVIILRLAPKGKGCELEFTHVNVPTKHVKDIEQGWKDYYWKPMKAMLENK